MTETIAYINNSLKELYPKSEINSLVRLIMERVCGLQPHQFLCCKDKKLSGAEKLQIQEITERLKKEEPIQYIIGVADFYSLEFEVNPSVLIPRPETEELAELIIREQRGKSMRILDIGTGSGCIAIALRKHLEISDVTAVDISVGALDTARRNAERNGVPITCIQTDILVAGQAEQNISGRFDLIVSNPPYIKENEKESMEKNVLGYEPHQALFVPNHDPLLFYRRIARFGKEKLTEEGFLYFEINAQCGPLTVEMLQTEGYRNICLIQDLSGKDRIIKAQR